MRFPDAALLRALVGFFDGLELGELVGSLLGLDVGFIDGLSVGV